MKVEIDNDSGFCFGVLSAIGKAESVTLKRSVRFYRSGSVSGFLRISFLEVDFRCLIEVYALILCHFKHRLFVEAEHACEDV